jgi:hypothetical protein
MAFYEGWTGGTYVDIPIIAAGSKPGVHYGQGEIFRVGSLTEAVKYYEYLSFRGRPKMATKKVSGYNRQQ